VNIGIVGCGAIAASHIRILRKLKPEASISLCDVDKTRVEAFAAQWSINKTHLSIDSLLTQEHPEAIHIVTPPGTHATLAEKALKASVHVFVEKPVTETHDQYLRLASIAQQQGRLLCGDYSTLGMPVVKRALEEIHGGSLGRLVAVHCTFAGSEGGGKIQYKDPNHWAYKLRGGILQNMVDHPLSLILSVMDPIEDHSLHVNRRNVLPFDCPDLLHLGLRNDNQVGSLTLALGHGCNERRAIFILEGGSIVIDMGRQLFSFTRGKGPQSFVKKAMSGILEGYAYAGGTVRNMYLGVRGKLARDPGIANVMESFYSSIEGGSPTIVRHEMVSGMTRLLDQVWEEIGYQPVEHKAEVAQ